MLKILLLSLSRQYTVDGQYIPSLFIEPEVRHDKTSYYNFVMTPKKYLQNFHTPKNIYFSENPQKYPPKNGSAYVCMKIEYPPVGGGDTGMHAQTHICMHAHAKKL